MFFRKFGITYSQRKRRSSTVASLPLCRCRCRPLSHSADSPRGGVHGTAHGYFATLPPPTVFSCVLRPRPLNLELDLKWTKNCGGKLAYRHKYVLVLTWKWRMLFLFLCSLFSPDLLDSLHLFPFSMNVQSILCCYTRMHRDAQEFVLSLSMLSMSAIYMLAENEYKFV